MRWVWSREHKQFSRKELILALEGLRVEIAGLKNHVRQLSKDIRALNTVFYDGLVETIRDRQ
jgi:hypothetical protein